jgi:hypothetical protein
LAAILSKSTTVRAVVSQVEPLFCEVQPLYNIADDWFDPKCEERDDHIRSSKLTRLPVSGHIGPTIFDRVMVDPFAMNALPHFHINDNMKEWNHICSQQFNFLRQDDVLNALNDLDLSISDTALSHHQKLQALKSELIGSQKNGVALSNPKFTHDILKTITKSYPVRFTPHNPSRQSQPSPPSSARLVMARFSLLDPMVNVWLRPIQIFQN